MTPPPVMCLYIRKKKKTDNDWTTWSVENLITKKCPNPGLNGQGGKVFTKEASCTNRALNLWASQNVRHRFLETKEQLVGHEVNFGATWP